MNKKTFLVLIILIIIVVAGAIIFVLNDTEEPFDKEKSQPENISENKTLDNKTSQFNETSNKSTSMTKQDEITREMELEMESEMKEYDSSEKIMDFVNQDFELIEKENKTNLEPVYELYQRKNGSKYEALRLARFVLQHNGFEAVYFVYKYDDGFDVVINFRDVDKPKYYYFEDNILKMKHHGNSFTDLIFSEEERRGISIDEFGVLNDNRLTKRDELNVLNLSEWEDKEEWVNRN